MNPGLALSDRQKLEEDYQRYLYSAVDVFIRGVYEDSTFALGSPVILASSAQPFTLAKVLQRWGIAADLLYKRITSNKDLDDIFLSRIRLRLLDASLPKDVYNHTRSMIVYGIEQQLSADELKAGLSEVLKPLEWEPAARRIARTEATAVYNYVALKNLDEPEKMWVARMDDATRESHFHANGQQQKVDVPFLVGQSRLMMPGDPTAPLHETAGCRCVIVGVE